MDKIQIYGLLINLIIYIIITMPIRVLSHYKKIYEDNRKFILILTISMIYFIIISFILYSFPFKIFSLFTNTSGIINYGVYAFKILFLSSSLFSIKLLIPNYLDYLAFFHNKKTELKVSEFLTSPRNSIFRHIYLLKKTNFAKLLVTFLVNKKAILKIKISKIAITVLLSIINFFVYNTKGIFFTISIVDFVYSIIYFYFYIIITTHQQ